MARNVAFLDRLPTGVQAIATPGHTSLLITDSHTEERVLILGDLLHSRAQFAEPTWHFRSDSDPVLAEGQRIDVLSRYRDAQTVIAGGHFAGDVFGAEPPGPAARPC